MTNRTKADLYLADEIDDIMLNGIWDKNPRPKYKDGTSANTKFVVHQFRQYNLDENEFPICTLRPMAWKSAIKEILWIFQKESNRLEDLHDMNVHVWDDWNVGDGTIGNRYGHTVHRYDIFKKRVLDDIKNDPYGRYHICNLWQEQEFIDEPNGLKPCAYETIWTVRGEYLDMLLNQRSGDLMAASGAGNWNEIQYAALLMMVARHTGYKPGIFSHCVINEQIYGRHMEQAEELKKRFYAKDSVYAFGRTDMQNKLPRLILNPDKTNFYDFTIDDFTLENYEATGPQLKLDLGI